MAARFTRIAELFVALLVFHLTGACAEHIKHLTTPQPHHKVERPASGPVLWKAADKDTTIYLFVTVHTLPEGTIKSCRKGKRRIPLKTL